MSMLLAKAKREWIALLSKIRLKKVRSNYLGSTLNVPVIYGIFNGGYIVPAEFWMGQCLNAFLQTKPGTVIDIGVNVGLYLVKLRTYSKDRPYIGFEPNPFCVFYTQELIRMNGFQNARILPVALSDSDGISRFYAAKVGDKTGSLIADSKDSLKQAYSLDVVTMQGDRCIEMLKPGDISVIKIDVEEAEIYVLRGLQNTLSKYRPYIYCEILYANNDPSRKQRADEIYNLIRALNYQVLGVHHETKKLTLINDVNDIGTAYEQEYIFCPNELLAKFQSTIGSTTNK